MTVPEAPCTIPLRIACPACDQALQVEVEATVQLVLTTDSDGIVERVLRPKLKAQTIAHTCNQTVLEFRGEVE
jgi:hypothetical protein